MNKAKRLSALRAILPLNVLFCECTDKKTVLESLLKDLSTAPQIKSAREFKDGINKREAMLSSAIGAGIAIPHVRLDSITDFAVSLAVCKAGIDDYDAPDERPVQLVLMIGAAQKQQKEYLKVLSAFSTLFENEDAFAAVVNAKSETQVNNIITEYINNAENK